MSIRRNNNLTRFIRKMLENSDAQQWNTPPDSVFENALVEVAAINLEQKRKRRRRAAVVLVAALLLLTTGLFLHEFYQMNQKIENLEVMIAADDTDAAASTITEETLIKSAVEETEAPSAITNDATDSGNNAPIGRNESVVASESREENRGAAMSDVHNAHLAEKETPANELANNSISNDGAIGPHDRTRSMVTIEPREDFYFPRVSSIDEAPTLEESTAPQVPGLVEPTLSKSRRLAIDLSMTSNFSTLVMKGEGGQAIITEYDKYYCGLGVSAGIEYKFSDRWSAVFRASYSQWNNHSRSQSSLAYNSANETVDQAGNPMYSTSGMIETPLGDHETLLNFYTSSVAPQDGDMITYMTDVDQSINVLSTSIGGRYTPLQIGRSALFVGMGADYTHELNSSNDMRTETYMQDKLLAALEERPQILSKHEVNYFSLYGEMGARIFLGGRTDLTTTLRYTRSLSSLRTAGTNEPKTFLSQISPTVGVNYYLD